MIITEMMQLQNPSQSSTETRGGCSGGICPPSAAIDGDLNTRSVTYGVNDDWWSAEMIKITRIDHINIRTTDYAFGEGYFDR